IEDIDSTLEQIDEQATAFEDGSEPGAVATGPSALSEPGAVPTGPNEQRIEPTVDPVATAPGSDSVAETKPKPTHHRHWRQRRNIALDFAPGEAVSVTRRLYRSG